MAVVESFIHLFYYAARKENARRRAGQIWGGVIAFGFSRIHDCGNAVRQQSHFNSMRGVLTLRSKAGQAIPCRGFATVLDLGATYSFDWALALVTIRGFGNLIHHIIIQIYAVVCLIAVSFLYLKIIQNFMGWDMTICTSVFTCSSCSAD
jgi:hypothetical protein